MSPTVMASVDSTTPLLGSCFLHQLAFPDGPQNADLSQPLCNLVQLNLEAFSCGDDAFNGLTGGDFIDMYSDAQAQFCSRNVDTIAQVLEGSHPQGQNILETSMAELVFVIGQKSSARRNLFFRQLIDATPDPWKPVAVIGVVFGICLVIGAAVYFLLGRRALARALTAEENTVALIRPTDVLQECVDHDIDSFVCELSMPEFMEIFTTGLCAGTVGLSCFLNQDQVLAAIGN